MLTIQLLFVINPQFSTLFRCPFELNPQFSTLFRYPFVLNRLSRTIAPLFNPIVSLMNFITPTIAILSLIFGPESRR